MTVKEVSERTGKGIWGIYRAIEDKRGIGLLFEKRKGIYFAYARDVKRWMNKNG